MLTAERLREVLDYNPLTGVFLWKVATADRTHVGDAAGWLDGVYWRIGIDSRIYRAHRLAWLYMTGEWPAKEIDHRDLDKSNNRWLNLRDATRSQNIANTRRPSTNTTGFKGVHFFKRAQRYAARICVAGKKKHLGYFDTAEAAHAAYAAAAAEYHGEFGRAA